MNITIQYHERQIGPYTLDEVNRRLRDGKIKPDALAWQEGTKDWVPLKTIPGVGVKASGWQAIRARLGKNYWKLWVVIAILIGLLINQMQEDSYKSRREMEDAKQHWEALNYAAHYDREEYNRLRQADEIARAMKRR